MAELAHSIAADIKSAMDADDLDLPTLPEVALRIREEAESEHVSANSLAAVVGEDPGLSAQLVRIANSPMFRATRSIDDLAQAISRLGVEYAANIVTGLAMQQMFQATSDMLDRKMRAVWKTSTEVAAWSSILSKRCQGLRPDQATLAGLTHSIGVLPILSWAEEHDHIIQDSMTLDRVVESIHPAIGTMILKHWNFAAELVAVPEHFQDLTRAADVVDYADIVCVANLLRTVAADSDFDPDWRKTSAFKRVNIDLDMDDVARAELFDEVADVKGVFA